MFWSVLIVSTAFVLTQQSELTKKYENHGEVVHNSAENKFFLVKRSTDSHSAGQSLNKVSWAGFLNSINSTGWAILEIETNPYFSDSRQAYAAGYLEGSLTSNLIAMQWENTIGDFCKGQESYCKQLKAFLKVNLETLKNNVTKFRETDPYWHHVGLVFEQLAGLQDGYKDSKVYGHQDVVELKKRPHMDIDVFNVYLFNIGGDLEDLQSVLNVTGKKQKVFGSGSCSALVKVLPGNSDLYASQDTWNDFGSMLRIIKHYNLSYHLNPISNKRIPGYSASFSSYPGTLQSGDDFYVLSSGLVSLETTIGNSNMDLYKSVHPEKVVLEWVRSIVANRLSTSGIEWAQYFSLYNSGTYNNQWMVVDYKLFTPGAPLKDNLIVVLEQIPTLIAYGDVTDVLRNQRYLLPSNFSTVFQDKLL